MKKLPPPRRPRRRTAGVIVATLLAAVAGLPFAMPAAAHSLKELEDQLSGRDKYFQPVDQPAPDFALVDAAGRAVTLAGFRDKIVVLNFIYANCGDVCPLHSQMIARLQSLVNLSPMRDQVAFIGVTTDPAHDHGTALTGYGEQQGLDPANWTFLTSAAVATALLSRLIAEGATLSSSE